MSQELQKKEHPGSLENRGELFSLLLRLHPSVAGEIAPNAGPQIQAAFLDLVHQADPVLAEKLHQPNQRRPYTLSLLHGFYHLLPEQFTGAMARQQHLSVRPEQVFWLRLTMLDDELFSTFVHFMLLKAQALSLRIGNVPFNISRIITTHEPQQTASSWAAYSSFAELSSLGPARKLYTFDFATPTAFSRGQRSWGKELFLFPTPGSVFENLARQWEYFAPAQYKLAAHNITPRDVESWCDEQMVVSQYSLSTSYLPSSRFGQTGFHGQITYEVKGPLTAPIALWLSTLSRFAFFSGIGYKTAMGMGQVRCTSLLNNVVDATEQTNLLSGRQSLSERV
jgi:CRISPR-associated endoribonuclease Cas6